MNESMRENIKVALLGLITVTLVVNTFFMDNKPSRKGYDDPAGSSSIATSPSISANSGNVNDLNPINPISPTQPNLPAPAAAPVLSETRAKTAVQFAESSHNFGKIKQDSKHTKIFKFTNTGKEPLIIENAIGSCGCTVPLFPKEPIKPGATGEIVVEYSPGKQQGAQTKTVTITANTDPIVTTLNISADVEVVP